LDQAIACTMFCGGSTDQLWKVWPPSVHDPRACTDDPASGLE
jgi:hypothetical protein